MRFIDLYSYQAMLQRLVAESKESGNQDCFLAKMLREQEKNGLDEEHIAYIGTTMVGLIHTLIWQGACLYKADGSWL